MTKKNIYRFTAILMALLVSGIFISCDLGLAMTPLSKFFIILFGAIIGQQSGPAALLFIGMIDGVPPRRDETTEPLLSNERTTTFLKARKILIVDKDKTVRQQLRNFFGDSHFEVETTDSAAYAIAKIVRKNEPIVIIGDSFAETISPADVVALMRKSNNDLRIVLLSDDSTLATLNNIREGGSLQHGLEACDQGMSTGLGSAVDGYQPAMS